MTVTSVKFREVTVKVLVFLRLRKVIAQEACWHIGIDLLLGYCSSVPASTETFGFEAFSSDLGNSSLINDFHDNTTKQASKLTP